MSVEYFHFEYFYWAFVNSINTEAATSTFVGSFRGVSHLYPIKSSAIKSFPKPK